MSKRTLPTIPQPDMTIASIHAAVVALKEAVELLAGQRGDARDIAVTWGDLADKGVITKEQVPKDVGSRRA